MSRINIGGQAVMEGVMMRNNDRYAVAVRKPDKQIEVKTNRCTGTSDRPAVCNLPIVRGVFSFVQSLTIGVKTLMYSAQFFEDEEEEAPKKEKRKNERTGSTCGESRDGRDRYIFDCAGSRTFYVASGMDCIAVRCCDKKPCADRTD